MTVTIFEEIDKDVEYPMSDRNLQARDISPRQG